MVDKDSLVDMNCIVTTCSVWIMNDDGGIGWYQMHRGVYHFLSLIIYSTHAHMSAHAHACKHCACCHDTNRKGVHGGVVVQAL